MEVGTHAAFAWHAGPLVQKAERLLEHLSSGMLVLADRCYCGFPLWSRAAGTGADLLWRLKGNMRFPVVEAHDDGSWRSVIRGSGRDRRRSRGELPVRIVAFRIEGGDETVTLATTLLAHYAVRRLIHEAADKAGRIQAEYPSCTPSVSCAAGSSIQATFPPEDRPTGVIDEILEERVVSGRGQVKPRGVRQKMSGFPPSQARTGVAPGTLLDTRNRLELCLKQQHCDKVGYRRQAAL